MNIPIDEKKKRMLELSEHDFRNNMIRTLFLSLGYSNPRETHGVDELGKDIIFTETDKLGHSRLIAIQTKKGKINMASKGSTNATNLVTQLRTALQTPVHIPSEKVKRNPDEVILCASGSINVRAATILPQSSTIAVLVSWMQKKLYFVLTPIAQMYGQE